MKGKTVRFRAWLFLLSGAVIVSISSALFTSKPAEKMKTDPHYTQNIEKQFDKLQKTILSIRKSNRQTQLQTVNDFFNALKYETDWITWHQKDYWASRKEFLGVGQGDCEDYAIAKYFTLRQLGYTNKQIFLTYVRAAQTQMPHIVLTYYESPDAMPLVLDSTISEILPANRRRDLKPIFNFNGDKIYMAKQRGLGRELPQGRINLDKWTDLIMKIQEGK